MMWPQLAVASVSTTSIGQIREPNGDWAVLDWAFYLWGFGFGTPPTCAAEDLAQHYLAQTRPVTESGRSYGGVGTESGGVWGRSIL